MFAPMYHTIHDNTLLPILFTLYREYNNTSGRVKKKNHIICISILGYPAQSLTDFHRD